MLPLEPPFQDAFTDAFLGLEDETPRGSVLREHWTVARLLQDLNEHVAPWWIVQGREDAVDGEELRNAAVKVEGVIEELTRLAQ